MDTNYFNIDKINGAKELSPLEKTVLQYILQNLDEARAIGVRGVATNNFTSTATVMRLAKKLKYSGFLEMIYSFKNKLDEQKSNTFNYLDLSINNFAQIRDTEELNMIPELIHQTTIYLYSEGFGEFITQYMYRKLLVLKKKVVLLHGLEIPLIHNPTEPATLFIISRSGETKTCLSKVDQIKHIKGKTISFTAKEGSSLYKDSDIAFLISDNKDLDSQNFHPTYFYGNCINMFEKIIEIMHAK